MNAAIIGLGLGFFVALQLGPMSLFLIRSTLRSGWKVGAAIGAGIAAVDGLYAAAGAGGATPLLAIHPVRLVLGLVGAIVLVWLGARTLYSALRVRIGGETPFEVSSPKRAFITALGGLHPTPQPSCPGAPSLPRRALPDWCERRELRCSWSPALRSAV